ncbi:P-type conjugative transfer ATPase TrbB [Desulfovibrio legallii]|uniref:Type IV secretion system protein VirB11 n=1 Tax=Desulfovibrio legallii TaxID=571438 RepID=A0A1G7KAW3_9BACT|nr:P-type conjugative transfer ATPase TrbB [Desulfovibrio legallii]SDF34181.1 type IV secretion system protein VirB11 [Desulfovibrio legallii]
MDERLLESLEYNCGDLIMGPLRDASVIEIMLNPDGRLWIEKYGQEQECIGDLPLAQGRLILSLVASALGQTVDALHPVVEGSFPLDGSRFEGTFPPLVGPGASFSLRKKASRVITMREYLEQGIIAPEVVPIIRHAILDRKNIVVVGGTSSGKTTFVNAIIHELDELCTHDRLLILEDTAELQSHAPNSVFFLTSELAGIGMRQLTKVCMRYAPRRILVGEVRDAAALELLKLWNTGHPGGVGTFHADSAEEALERLEELVEEAGVGPKQKLIGRAIDMIIYMEKTRQNTRRLASIISVNKFNAKEGRYETRRLYSAA